MGMTMNVFYGANGFAAVVQREINARREVVLTVRGWKRKIALRILAFFYATHESHPPERRGTRSIYAGTAWRTFLMPTFMALCVQARQAGMSIKAYEKPDCLDIYFQPWIKGGTAELVWNEKSNGPGSD
jgi:hypothetical protein